MCGYDVRYTPFITNANTAFLLTNKGKAVSAGL